MTQLETSGVYSNNQIFDAVEKQHIIIDPFNPQHVNGSSYDVLLGQYFYHSGNGIHEQAGDSFYNPYDEADVKSHFGELLVAEPYSEHQKTLSKLGVTAIKGIPSDHPVILLRPHERILAHTHEFIGIKAPGTTSMQARSTTGRNGIVVCMDAGWGDPGYTNRWTMEIKNQNEQYTVLPTGIRIAQIVFHHTGVVRGEYSELSGKYQSTSSNNIDEIKANWHPSHMLPKAYKDSIEPLPPVTGLQERLR